MKFCSNCGASIVDGSKFCKKCGNKLKVIESSQTMLSSKISKNPKIKFNLVEIFSDTFKQHTTQDAEKIFGGSSRPLTLKEMEVENIRPWLFLKIFVALLISATVFYITASYSYMGMGGFAFFAALGVPITVVMFFFEVNITREVSFYNVLKSFLQGAVSSGILSLTISNFISGNVTKATLFSGMTFWDAFIEAGLPEEIGKAVIVIYLINKLKPKYILSGIVIGVAVGAGFAVTETAGYITIDVLNGLGNQQTTTTAFYLAKTTAISRSFLAFGGHISWAALEAAGLMSAKGVRKFTGTDVFNLKFLIPLVAAILIHSAWDTSYIFGNSIDEVVNCLKMFICGIIAFAFVLFYVRKGIIQIFLLKKKALQHEKLKS